MWWCVMENKGKENLYEAYTDEDGFVWDENGDIVSIPEPIKQNMDAQFELAQKMVREGKINAWK